MRLRTTLLGLLVVIAIVLSGTVYAGFSLHKGDIVEQERTNLNATAESIAENLDTRFDEKRTMIRLAAANPHVVPGGSGSHPDAVVDRFVDRTAFDGASIVDDEGVMRAIAARNLTEDRRQELLGGNFSHRSYVRRALAGETYIGDPVTAESGNTIVTISTPIRRDGRVVGAFTGTLHLERAAVFSDLSSTLEGGQVLRLGHENRTIHRSGPSPQRVLRAAHDAGLSGWTVTVEQDREPLESALFVATVTQFGAVGVAILSIALVGVWISRTTLGNIRGLISGLNRLEAGDYEQTIDLGRTTEWSRISTQFNSLADTLEQRESQLRVLNRVLRHNLRNDMSVVIAHSETILEDEEGGPTASKVETIRQTAYNLIQTSEHARAIYEDLLSDEGVERRPVDLVGVVESTVDRLRAEFPESHVEAHLPDEAWVLDGETAPIVVDELCRNALIHNDRPPAEREVDVDVEVPESGDVRLIVRDNGPGLPAVEAELLTGDRQETSIEHGSGLGLWVVNWLVAQLDGETTLQNTSDRGSSVTIRLPSSNPPADTDEAS